MRNAFAAELLELASADGRVVMLSGDIGNRLFDTYRDRFPDRFYNCGVAEANMMGVAAGLALTGLRPIVYTITPFVTTRCYEQIRVDVCYHEAPVIIVGVGAGLSYASLGPTHHSCEDIACLRALPDMAVVCPADPVETSLSLRAALRRPLPTYIRLGKKGEPAVHQAVPDFEIGRAITICHGTEVCLLATGTILPEVLEAAGRLEQNGISAQVVSFHTVKPLDDEYLACVMRDFSVVAVIEEHSLLGGFGSAVAEWLADRPPQRARLLRFGTPDRFLHSSGEQEHHRKACGLSAERISERILREMRSSLRLSA
jgi:transketolase